ncbi:MAG TPA: hypothetical protein VKG82_11440 [Solirubrobacteraceae bacterium]|nr:hypothetical protein [Solirubrobacteraceae bacterium]
MKAPTLLAVPNFSEGRDETTIAAIADALLAGVEGSVRLLDVHSDRDHDRSVFTLAGDPSALVEGLMAGARVACERIDVVTRPPEQERLRGQHPHVGALDVAPIVYVEEAARGAACATALVLADRIGAELAIPVFLYGELTQAPGGDARTRAELRRGGVQGLAARMDPSARSGSDAIELPPLRADFGPQHTHASAGATLVAARPPLVAFNLQLAPPARIEDARAVAARIREGGEDGLPGLRAIAVALAGGVAQVSTNVERPLELPIVRVVEAVARIHPVASVELVGLAPAAALQGLPAGLPMPGFDPARHIIENALGC